eukprot:4899167-Alexandrium_andersonii.AAC.1
MQGCSAAAGLHKQQKRAPRPTQQRLSSTASGGMPGHAQQLARRRAEAPMQRVQVVHSVRALWRRWRGCTSSTG